MKKTILMALSAALVLSMSACADKSQESSAQSTKSATSNTIVTEEELGLRKENLYTEKGVAPVKKVDVTAAPGTAKRFERSYENAPPLIPHSVDGLLPITRNNNACLGCHMPEVASSVGATPIPPTHFMDFRTQKKLDHLAQQRFNCSQCHVPQANVKPLVKNTFQPDYRNPNEKKRSNLIDTLNEGVK
ncbi:nitrate reductase cytochrome c-type subunit [Hydrogenimonas cancrithermarum]|uniref:Periplasmic nitrate reductase, electron transfer subunit n=1 Tax=Hydrogenimonas cancrithermarum TaxID=2993563 RepID=A0ABM8FPF7_9BACT|nr:nitrate reductase cytochrome c-type subunit [Hydrogenimonas cancrithermarum]BDY13632.1 periplasmic nitrate reductase, electron transfer subunit [Hydrogenimonas cancrithermarum]